MTTSPQAATAAYIDGLGTETLAKAAAYTKGNHWLLVMAERAGVPADRIFVCDGSRQSNNFTANAGAVGGMARIAISDVAFKGASLDEVKTVTGHEIGHYVLGHTWQLVVAFSGLAILFFLLVKTAEYRNPRPSRLEEWLFYDHPSFERRVQRAIEWQASQEAK
jgi:Zn-dependent protease with chaperone function